MNAIDPAVVLPVLKWLAQAVSKDPTRISINRIFVDESAAVATDGHRLHVVKDSGLPAGFSIRSWELDLVLSTAKVLTLCDVLFSTVETVWSFKDGPAEARLQFAVSQDQYVDWTKVVPREEDGVEKRTADLRKSYVPPEGSSSPEYCVVGDAHLNARYVAEALKGAPKSVQVFSTGKEEDPVLFAYDARRAVVMPVRK